MSIVFNQPNLKSILHSKRANIYYLEKCRVLQKDGRILYLTQNSKENKYWNIPVANTTTIILGTGTSITQGAMRILSSAGVLVGFSGTGSTPLYIGTEIEWLTPQNEYRPTEYVQGWMKFWFDEVKRLEVAKKFQIARIAFIKSTWEKDKELKALGFTTTNKEIAKDLENYKSEVLGATSTQQLLQIEARLTKRFYKLAASLTNQKGFIRSRETTDKANNFLNHGNYLAYGLAASTLWVLGIPHGFAVMHGKTRRGALVFDVADLIKDALILPWAFICANERYSEQEFRQQCINNFMKFKAHEFMFENVKDAAINSTKNCE